MRSRTIFRRWRSRPCSRKRSGHHGASRPGRQEVRGPETADAVSSPRKASPATTSGSKQLRVRRGEGETLHLNPQPFLADKRSGMQGYVGLGALCGREGRGLQAGSVSARRLRLSAGCSTLIETRRDLVKRKPALVQRLVDASIIGWYNYIYGDNKPANALIKQHKSRVADDLLAYSVASMKEHGQRRVRRCHDARRRRHDRRAHEELLRQDGACRRGQALGRSRQGLYVAVA